MGGSQWDFFPTLKILPSPVMEMVVLKVSIHITSLSFYTVPLIQRSNVQMDSPVPPTLDLMKAQFGATLLRRRVIKYGVNQYDIYHGGTEN